MRFNKLLDRYVLLILPWVLLVLHYIASCALIKTVNDALNLQSVAHPEVRSNLFFSFPFSHFPVIMFRFGRLAIKTLLSFDSTSYTRSVSPKCPDSHCWPTDHLILLYGLLVKVFEDLVFIIRFTNGYLDEKAIICNNLLCGCT
jgi:hypothetical protein